MLTFWRLWYNTLDISNLISLCYMIYPWYNSLDICKAFEMIWYDISRLWYKDMSLWYNTLDIFNLIYLWYNTLDISEAFQMDWYAGLLCKLIYNISIVILVLGRVRNLNTKFRLKSLVNVIFFPKEILHKIWKRPVEIFKMTVEFPESL